MNRSSPQTDLKALADDLDDAMGKLNLSTTKAASNASAIRALLREQSDPQELPATPEIEVVLRNLNGVAHTLLALAAGADESFTPSDTLEFLSYSLCDIHQKLKTDFDVRHARAAEIFPHVEDDTEDEQS
ncbi:MAG TPA: hypothetical protein VN809_03005 [Telmatospirillum sp.]|nr:hypothetical protein [Telmatospirillum sp.]